MKAALFLLLALGAAFASACADKYNTCQCIGTNSQQNSSATDDVCKSFNYGQIVSGNGDECQGGEDMNNCHWDDFCALAQGVLPAYSSCSH